MIVITSIKERCHFFFSFLELLKKNVVDVEEQESSLRVVCYCNLCIFQHYIIKKPNSFFAL